MDHYELSMALAMEKIADLRRQADRQRLANRSPSRAAGRRGDRASRSPRLPGRHGQTAAHAGGGRVAAAATASGSGRATTEVAMLLHDHEPGVFDPGHCRTCARQAGLLDHYDRVQRAETRLRQASEWARAAHRHALWALGSSGVAILLVTVTLLTR